MYVVSAVVFVFIAVSAVLCLGWHRGRRLCGVRLRFEAAREVMLLGLCGKLGTLD